MADNSEEMPGSTWARTLRARLSNELGLKLAVKVSDFRVEYSSETGRYHFFIELDPDVELSRDEARELKDGIDRFWRGLFGNWEEQLPERKPDRG